MTGLYDFFGENAFVTSFEEHSDCHAVIDGSNLQYFFSSRTVALSNLPSYEQSVRDFFRCLSGAKITPHVFFDGPTGSEPHKWERGRIRREERLQKLAHGTTNFRVLDYPQPVAAQDIFRDVVNSLGIRAIQVSAKRDYSLEMVSHARFLDAILISGNAKFFVENIPRGFVCLKREAFAACGFKLRGSVRTFHFKKLSQLVDSERSPNPHALAMWAVVVFNRKTFELFTKLFYGKAHNRPRYFPTVDVPWVGQLVSGKYRKLPQLKLLQFFLEHSRTDAERLVLGELNPGDRRDATRFFSESMAAQLVEPHDVFEKLERQIETGEFCDEELPQWFLRYFTVENKLLPAVSEILSERQYQLVSFLEDFNKKSVNESTLRLRRIIYGIFFPESGDVDRQLTVTELDRVGDKLAEFDRTPLRILRDPEDPSGARRVPSLKEMEFLPETERLELFLMSMGVEKDLRRNVVSDEAMYVLVILRYWITANADITKTDLLRVLLTVLLVEREYSKPSHIFKRPVQVSKSASADLGINFQPNHVPGTQESCSCMHPLALLQNATRYGRMLHRLFMQPLGADSDVIEAITSEVAFYHVIRVTKHLEHDELKDLIARHMDPESVENFDGTFDLIWEEKAVIRGRDVLGDIIHS